MSIASGLGFFGVLLTIVNLIVWIFIVVAFFQIRTALVRMADRFDDLYRFLAGRNRS